MPIKFKQSTKYEEEGIAEEVSDKGLLDKVKANKGIAVIVVVAIVAVIVVIALRGSSTLPEKPNDIVAAVESEGITSGFTDEEVIQLRDAGYTGTEIEDAQANGDEFQNLLDVARERKKAYLEDLYEDLKYSSYKSGSPEFNALLNNTWLGGRVRTIPATDVEETYSTMLYRDNCTYVKLPPRGNQLYVKLTMSDNTVTFYNIPPNRYAILPEKGNMVIEYDEMEFKGEKFITAIREIGIWEAES